MFEGKVKENVKFTNILIYLLLGVVCLYVFFPIAWMLSTSFKTDTESLAIPPTWIPKVFTVHGWGYMWQMKPFLLYLFNSSVISGATAFISVFFGALAAYSISRFQSRFLYFYLLFVLMSQMIPGVLLVGPFFKILNKLGLYDSRTGLIIGYTSDSLPFCIWMLKGYFDGIPKELDEAARLDGCSRLRVFFYVLLPLSIPAMVATGIFAFLMGWGDLLYALCLTSSDRVTTVTLGLANCVSEFRVFWPALMAAGIVASLPPVIIYFFLQRYLISGMARGAVKG